MAYARNRVLVFGAAGIVIAALLILAFIPAQKEVGLKPMVALQEIPDYGFQIVKMSKEQADVAHLYVTLDGFEFRRADGDWAEIEIPGGSISFDLLRVREISFDALVEGLDARSYSAIRFRVVQGLEFTNATLSSGEVIGVDVPSFKVEFTTPTFEKADGMESLLVELRTGSGQLSNYMLPKLHLALGTIRVKIARVGGFGIYLIESGELVISDLEIIYYNKTSHEIKLTDVGVEKIESLQVPMNGTGFVIKVEGREIYRGAFWSPISSLPYHGVVIETLVNKNFIRIEAGYPSSQFQNEDPRDNPKIFDYLEEVGKLTN